MSVQRDLTLFLFGGKKSPSTFGSSQRTHFFKIGNMLKIMKSTRIMVCIDFDKRYLECMLLCVVQVDPVFVCK